MDEKLLIEQLKDHNNKVKQAIKERSKFLDENMKYFAEFQIGDKVYNCKTNTIGIVKEHYRYNADKPEYDTYFDCDCRIEEPVRNGMVDNTSRYGGVHPWVKLEDYENETKAYINRLKMCASSY